MEAIIPEPKFVLAAQVDLANLEERFCSEELPTAAHLEAEIHLNCFNVASEMPWRLVVGWRTHEPVTITKDVARSVSPITSGISTVLTGDHAIFAQVVEQERYIDANTGLLLEDFDHLLQQIAHYVHSRASAKRSKRLVG
jgi:hypothetical protein